ncbi:MAG TPA: hypothetical protein VMT52_04370, partial [Planctomycetota bacterium]|nr:hypothetical protein [Planctomycetota bacterium]
MAILRGAPLGPSFPEAFRHGDMVRQVMSGGQAFEEGAESVWRAGLRRKGCASRTVSWIGGALARR